MSATERTLSVVVPCFDEKENLEELTGRLLTVLRALPVSGYEVVFVDDGSRDGSGVLLDRLSAEEMGVRTLHLSRNFGHQAALSAGLEAASGDAVVLMDADLQDPPELIERFVQEWVIGNEVVYAIRRSRREGALRRLTYALFYRSFRLMAELDVPLDAGDFCLLDRRVVDAILTLPERNRFLRGLRSWVGFRQVGVPFDRDARHGGQAKYTTRKLIRLALSGYIGFSSMPLRVGGVVGALALLASVGLGIWALVSKFTTTAVPPGWTSTVGVILLMGGAQLLVLAIMSEYLARVYDEVRRRPIFLIRERVGFDRPPGQTAPAAEPTPPSAAGPAASDDSAPPAAPADV